MRAAGRSATLGSLIIWLAAAGLTAQQPGERPVPRSAPGVSGAAFRRIEAARRAAGAEWETVFRVTCGGALSFAGPPRVPPARSNTPPPVEEWHRDPVKVFDNLYYVGMQEHSAWAITTTDGIIIVDALYDYSVAHSVEQGLRTLGLNPAEIKYVLVTHAHADHAGGAKYLQEKFGARVVMSAADYELLSQQNPPWLPRHDVTATDAMPLTLGDVTIALHVTPGHTLGTLSMVFPVRDRGRRHLVATWGGTGFNFGADAMRLSTYAAQAGRMKLIAMQHKADVLLSNHTQLDASDRKLPMMSSRGAGAHPFVIGTDAVGRYFDVVGSCAGAGERIVLERGKFGAGVGGAAPSQ
jgi:metallo-beta-lactamase class B